MEEGYTSFLTSHLPGSVPAVVSEEGKQKRISQGSQAFPSNLQIFPPANGGYQPSHNPTDGDDQSSTTWKGYFNLSSYTPYFNVDTDVVVERLITAVYPMEGFHRKIDSNPDLYAPVWVSTTLIFTLAVLGNFAAYMFKKGSDPTKYNFDVGYVNWAATAIYGYAIAVPAAYWFLFQYFGSRQSLVKFWCMWGYSLFIFVLASLLLVIPVDFFRWVIVLLAGAGSSWFVMLNLKAYAEGTELTALVTSAAVLQFALAVFIKIFFA